MKNNTIIYCNKIILYTHIYEKLIYFYCKNFKDYFEIINLLPFNVFYFY